jgi:hypothetical protein
VNSTPSIPSSLSCDPPVPEIAAARHAEIAGAFRFHKAGPAEIDEIERRYRILVDTPDETYVRIAGDWNTVVVTRRIPSRAVAVLSFEEFVMTYQFTTTDDERLEAILHGVTGDG